MKNKKVSWITKTAILSAISIVLYFFVKFPLPFLFPGFLDVQISNLPAIIAGFLLGPWGGAAVVIIRTLVKLPFSSTGMVGELGDFIIGLSVVLVGSIIYRRHHDKKGAIIALISSSITWVVVGVLINWLILVPWYIYFFFRGDVSSLVTACGVIPGINESNYMVCYLFLACLPFNLLLAIINNSITFLVYKKIHFLFNKMDYQPKNNNQ